MKLDLQSLSTEPLVYMLMHSGAFVTVLGIVFFLIGLLFGRAAWGRYKRQTRELRVEATAMKEEIADLKRKLGELSVKSGPAVSMVTETIPMPRSEPAAAVLPAAPAPPSSAQPDGATPAGRSAAAPPTGGTGGNGPATAGPSKPAGNVIVSKTAGKAHETSSNAEVAAPCGTPPASGGAEPAGDEATGGERGTEPVPARNMWVPASASGANGGQPPATRGPSALAAIITHSHVPHEALKAPEVGEIPTLPEIPLPAGTAPAKAEVKPEVHPHLGLIYKDRPAQVDDLTALTGVARTLEQRLHVLGVYTYEQIAAWKKDQVREFSARLAFKDRIEREQWVEQAKDLVAKKKARAETGAGAG